MNQKKPGLYNFLITLPDRLYPFATIVEGKKVRGSRSYQQQLERIFAEYGVGKLGVKLMAYRQTCHFVGSVLFIVCAAVLSHMLFGSNSGLYLMLAAAIVAITFQEFYLHPRTHGQGLKKGVLDWIAWTTPIALFIYITAL